MGVGTEIGDAYISVHADTKPFRAEIAALRKTMSKEMGRLNKDLGTTGSVGERNLNKIKKGMIESRRRVVRLYLLGYESREIARMLDWTGAKTRNLLSRGLADLRHRLDQQGVGPGGMR